LNRITNKKFRNGQFEPITVFTFLILLRISEELYDWLIYLKILDSIFIWIIFS